MLAQMTKPSQRSSERLQPTLIYKTHREARPRGLRLSYHDRDADVWPQEILGGKLGRVPHYHHFI